MSRGDTIFENAACLLTRGDGAVVRHDTSLLVQGDRIADVREGRIPGEARRIDASDLLIIPGMISGHTHTCPGIPSRGLIEEGRSASRMYELMEELDDESIDDLTAIGLSEILRSGCTTQIEMSFSQRQCESYVRTARRWGVRGYPGVAVPPAHLWRTVWDGSFETLLAYEQEALRSIEEYASFARGINGAEDGRLRPMATPHAPDTQTEATLDAWLAVARELGNGIHIHLAQTRTENARVRERFGLTSIQWLERRGIFSERVFGAHLSGIDFDADLPVLQRADAFTATHNPSSLGSGGESGCQPYPELLGSGINTAIGLDSHARDMLEQVKLAVLFGRARCFTLPPAPDAYARRLPTVLDAVLSATRRAADGLGRPDLGRIEIGAKADLVAIDVSAFPVGPGATPPEPLNQLMYANGTAVRHVMTDGILQVANGRLLVDDERRIRERAGRVMRSLWRQLRAEGIYDVPAGFPAGWPWTWSDEPGRLVMD